MLLLLMEAYPDCAQEIWLQICQYWSFDSTELGEH